MGHEEKMDSPGHCLKAGNTSRKVEEMLRSKEKGGKDQIRERADPDMSSWCLDDLGY